MAYIECCGIGMNRDDKIWVKYLLREYTHKIKVTLEIARDVIWGTVLPTEKCYQNLNCWRNVMTNGKPKRGTLEIAQDIIRGTVLSTGICRRKHTKACIGSKNLSATFPLLAVQWCTTRAVWFWGDRLWKRYVSMTITRLRVNLEIRSCWGTISLTKPPSTDI